MPFGVACDASHNIQRIIIYYAHEHNFTVNIKIKKTLNKFRSRLLPKANNNFQFNLTREVHEEKVKFQLEPR